MALSPWTRQLDTLVRVPDVYVCCSSGQFGGSSFLSRVDGCEYDEFMC